MGRKICVIRPPAAQGESTEEKELRLYELAIAAEDYNRNLFQSRLSYHTNILVALVTAIGAGYLGAQHKWHFVLVGLFSLLFVWLCVHTEGAVRRSYEHFIECHSRREIMEVRLGLRDPQTIHEEHVESALATVVTPVYWPHGFLFTKAWVKTSGSVGYFVRMRTVFRIFAMVGFVSALFAFAVAAPTRFQGYVLGNAQTPAKSAASPQAPAKRK
jgi:hypothetical protein